MTNRERASSALKDLESIMNALARERDGLIDESIQQSRGLWSQSLYINRLESRIRELETMSGLNHQPFERPLVRQTPPYIAWQIQKADEFHTKLVDAYKQLDIVRIQAMERAFYLAMEQIAKSRIQHAKSMAGYEEEE